jgi:S1-C subfamily serine protease
LPGDVVLTYQAQPIADINAFRNAVLATAVGQPVRVTLVRRGQPTSVLGRLGFEAHDILLAINNQPLTGVESLAELTSALQPPQRLVILGLDHRSGETGVVQVELQE